MSGPSAPGRFTTGSTMRHVTVMTLTSSLGLSFMFLVDAATLFYVSLLGEAALTAGVGLAWAVQFFTISIGIGLAIAATAIVSRAIGARDRDRARRLATASFIVASTMLAMIALIVIASVDPILDLLDARGESREVARRFLTISVPSLPFVGLAMIGSSVLRAEGDAKRSMYVTMSAGIAAVFLDPLFIFGLGLGVDGAAYAIVLSRALSGCIALWFCIKAHDLCAPPSLTDLKAALRPLFAVAAPAMATQLSTPVGNYILTRWMTDFGDEAVAGWAVASRLTVLAFGGIFALSGAIGGIVGQNYGAHLPDRVARAYRDSLIFAGAYIAVAWALLILGADLIVMAFGAEAAGADVIRAFCYVGAGAFLFNGMIFVANAAFNNLGHPLWSTGANWARDGMIAMIAFLMAGAATSAVVVIYAQALGGLFVGVPAAWLGWRLTHNLRETHTPVGGWQPAPSAPGTARAALAVLQNQPAPSGAGGRDDLDTPER